MNIWLKSWDLLTMEKLGFIPPLDECSLYNSYSYHFFLGVQCLALFWSPSQIHPEWSHPLLSSCGNTPPLCETQLPGGIHRTCQKDRPEGKLHSPGTHCWLKWERATSQSHCLVPQKHTATKREANNINGLHAQLLPNADHLPVPWAPFEHDLQCFSSDTFLCLPRHRPTRWQCLVCARKLRVQVTRVQLPPPQSGIHGLLSSALCSLGSPPDDACGLHS